MTAASTTTTAPGIPNAQLWTGRVLGGLCILFLVFDSIGKIVRVDPVVQGTVELGYPDTVLVPLGLVLLASTILYAIPATAVLGAILVTGYLGGAVATHVRVGNPLLTHTLFPVWLGIALWGALWLRDPRLRALVPIARD
ncbi:MAG: DoxX family protein [Candidatus Binatia bacterium]